MRSYDGGTIDPRRKSEPGSGGHKGRPYERTEGGAVGAGFMPARTACTLAERAPTAVEPSIPDGNRNPVRAAIKAAPTREPKAGL